MKSKLNYKSKKFMISVAVIVILLIIAIIGIILLVKSNNTSDAVTETSSNASSDKIKDSSDDKVPIQENDKENNDKDAIQEDDNQGALSDVINDEENKDVDINTNKPIIENTNNNVVNNNNNNNENIIVDTDATTVIEYVDEEKVIEKKYEDSWKPEAIKVDSVAKTLNVLKRRIHVDKKLVSYVDVSENEEYILSEMSENEIASIEVDIDDELTYEITVKNTGNVDLKDVKVTDVMKKEDAAGISSIINEVILTDEEKLNVSAGETKTLTFKYIVQKTDIVNGKIINIAIGEIPEGEDFPEVIPEESEPENTLTEQTHILKVNYVFEDGTIIDESLNYVGTYNYGDIYSILSPTAETSELVKGYKPEKTVVEGKMPETDHTEIVKYVTDETQTKELSYTVEYYQNGNVVTADTQTVTKTVQVLEADTLTVNKAEINTTNKYVGYKFDAETTGEIPSEVTTGTIIKVYYVTDETQTKELSYTVEYYQNGVKVEADTQTVTKTVQVLEADTLTVNKAEINTTDKYAGYKLDTENTIIPDTVESGTVIKVYYITDPTQVVDVVLTKNVVDENGDEVETLYEFKEGDIVRFKLTVTNKGTISSDTYTVTDTLPSELSFSGIQPADTIIDGNTLTWTITNLGAGESKSITIVTTINYDKWSTRPNSLYNGIDDVVVETGNENIMTQNQYNSNNANKNLYKNDSSYINCSFNIYNSQNGEVPKEDGNEHHAGGYTTIGFGRVSGIEYDKTLRSVDNLNAVIAAHNKVQDKIVFAPNYDPGPGKVVLWYVSKKQEYNWGFWVQDLSKNETVDGTTAYIQYHVDGIIVDLEDVYSVSNTAKGSNNVTSTDSILVKNTVNGVTEQNGIEYSVKYFKDDRRVEYNQFEVINTTINVEERNYENYSLSKIEFYDKSKGSTTVLNSLTGITVGNGDVIKVYYTSNVVNAIMTVSEENASQIDITNQNDSSEKKTDQLEMINKLPIDTSISNVESIVDNTEKMETEDVLENNSETEDLNVKEETENLEDNKENLEELEKNVEENVEEDIVENEMENLETLPSEESDLNLSEDMVLEEVLENEEISEITDDLLIEETINLPEEKMEETVISEVSETE